MKYINKEVSTYRHPIYVGCEPVARATWWNVLCLCCELENGGRLAGAKGWNDRVWQQTAAVMLSEVNASAPLLTWDGDDLVVWGYPGKVQARLEASADGGGSMSEAKAQAARMNGQQGGRPRKNNPPETHGETHGKPTVEKTQVKPKEGGREGGREGEREGEIPPLPPKGGSDGREPASLSDVIAFFAESDVPSEVAEDFFNHYAANGWKQGGRTALVSWQAAARKSIGKWRRDGSSVPKNSPGRGAPTPEPFDPTKPHAHTGGLPVYPPLS